MSEIKVNSIKGVGASAAAITVNNSDGTCTANITNNLSNRNLIINGSQIVSQRATSATSKTSTGYYCTDRFRFVDNNIGTFTLAQSTDTPTGFAKSLRLDCTTADTSIAAGDYLSVDHAIEGSSLQQLDYGLSSAKTITISFYVKSTTTGTYTLEIYMNDGEYFNSKTYTISSANTWERKTVTFAGNTSNSIADDNTRGLTCNFWLSNGSNFEGGTFSDGTWHNTTNKRVHASQVNIASSTDNDWSITGVQLEVGSVATDFEHRSFGQELALCQRYFYMHAFGAYVYTPNKPDSTPMGMSARWTNVSHYGMIYYPVQMRAHPSLYKSLGTDRLLHYGNNNAQGFNDVSTQDFGVNGSIVNYVNSLDSSAEAGWIQLNNNNAYVGFDAEI